MPRTKRKTVAAEDRTETRKRRISAGHEPTLDVNTLAAPVEPLGSETNIQEDAPVNESGMDHAEEVAGSTSPLHEEARIDENKHDVTATSNTIKHDQELESKNSGGSPATSRKDIIRRMVEHRKHLLDRVRLGRTSVEQRIAARPHEAVGEDQEIIAFQNMIKSVNSDVRKQQQSQLQKQQDGERRSAGRRGSAVQKRNSAVSTLPSAEEALELSLRSETTTTRRPKAQPPPIVLPERKVVICEATSALRRRRDEILDQLKARPAENPPRLPQRRQTHWDKVLQEMAWVATDFREERKWKVAAAQLMGNEVVRQLGLGSIGENGAKRDSISPVLSENESKVVVEADTSTMDYKEDFDAVPEVVSEPSVFTADDSPLIDETNLRKIALALSKQIFVASRENNDGDSTLAECTQTETKSADSGSPQPQVNGAQYEVVDQFIDNVLKLIKDPPRSRRASSSERYGQKLTEQQVDAVQSVEDRWRRVNVGACLKGPLSTGKTVIACALLWRHRDKGVALVVCKEDSLVRIVYFHAPFCSIRRLSDPMGSRTSTFPGHRPSRFESSKF